MRQNPEASLGGGGEKLLIFLDTIEVVEIKLNFLTHRLVPNFFPKFDLCAVMAIEMARQDIKGIHTVGGAHGFVSSNVGPTSLLDYLAKLQFAKLPNNCCQIATN